MPNSASSTPSTQTTSYLRTKSCPLFSILPKTWRKSSRGLTPLFQAGLPHPHVHLSLLDVSHTVDVATTTVVVAVDVVCPTCALDVAASTTSSRNARRQMMPFSLSDVGECSVVCVESEVGAVLRGAGEEGTVLGCL
jgi:hypothetical protein